SRIASKNLESTAALELTREWGSRGRWFKSSHSDQESPETIEVSGLFLVSTKCACHVKYANVKRYYRAITERLLSCASRCNSRPDNVAALTKVKICRFCS